MTLAGKRGIGLLLTGALIATSPMRVFAAEKDGARSDDTLSEQSIYQSIEEDNTIIDMEEAGYYIRLSEKSSYYYTGREIQPEFEIMYRDEDNSEKKADLEKDTDYTVEYRNNVDVSSDAEKKPEIVVKGICEDGKGYEGTLMEEFEIIECEEGTSKEIDTKAQVSDISECTITLGINSYVCDGTEKKPAVTVKNGDIVLTEGTDYTVEYKNNVNIGTATVKVTGCGVYGGSKEEAYIITLGETALTSTSSYSKITLRWNAVRGASGYQIYRSTSKTTGFKAVKTITSATSVSYADSNTKFNSTYYYKIRAYCSVNGKTVYGNWSPVKGQKKKLAAPQITTAKKTETAIKIKWKKVGGASGYVVYRAASANGKYKKIATIKKKSTVSYTDKKYSGGFYKVKAYRQIKKKKYYGYASAAKEVAKPVSSQSSGGGWRYVNGYKLYYDKNGKLVKDVSSIIGKQSSYVIKVNKKKNCVTVYAKDGKKGYIIPVKAFPCSAGHATPITTARTPAKYRWHALNGNCYGQWCTRIKQGFLFHSVMYGKTKNTTLSVSNYNKLGKTASHGCIRLRAGDAKWIYDNCKLKTKVIIYNSSKSGPLGKPKATKLPKWHKWDPTDPTARYKCRKKGCH